MAGLDSVAGMLVAGFYGVVTPPYPVKVFAELDGALAWLGRPESLDTVLALRAELRRDAELLDRLRAHISSSLADATLASTARALALSERTLQRRLRDANTSFQTLLTAARIRAAEALPPHAPSNFRSFQIGVTFLSQEERDPAPASSLSCDGGGPRRVGGRRAR